MTVSTFLVTFPNGHILYLGSWHHETQPAIVYEDEMESARPGAWTQTSRQRCKMAAGGLLLKELFYMQQKRFSENSLPNV